MHICLFNATSVLCEPCVLLWFVSVLWQLRLTSSHFHVTFVIPVGSQLSGLFDLFDSVVHHGWGEHAKQRWYWAFAGYAYPTKSCRQVKTVCMLSWFSFINTTLLQYDLPCGFISACATDGCLQHVFDACVVLLLADWVKLPAVCCWCCCSIHCLISCCGWSVNKPWSCCIGMIGWCVCLLQLCCVLVDVSLC